MEDSNDTAFLTAIQKVLPDTKVFASGIISTSHYPEKDFEPRNTAIKIACASVANCTYIDRMERRLVHRIALLVHRLFVLVHRPFVLIHRWSKNIQLGLKMKRG
jgi:hypothetical protein